MNLNNLKSFTSILLICVSIFGGATRVAAQRSQIRTDSRITYHNGPIMPGTPAVYLIFYGNWSGSISPQILSEFMSGFGGSPYLQMNTTYPDANGARPSGGLLFAGSVGDLYSHGPSLSVQDMSDVVIGKIAASELPLDSNGIYLIVAPGDVTDLRISVVQQTDNRRALNFWITALQVRAHQRNRIFLAHGADHIDRFRLDILIVIL